MKSSKNPMRPWTFRLAGRSWGPTAEGVMDLPTLQQIVDVLNGDKHPDATELLQSLVQRWKDAAWDVDKVCDSDPLVAEMLPKLWQVCYLPSSHGGASLMPMFIGPTTMSTFFKHVIKDGPLKNLFDGNHPLILAVQYFGALTVIEWQKLGGPCARCHRYYIKRRASQKTYCSRRCGNAATATVRTAKQREHDRQANLQRAQKAIQQWRRGAKGTDWKVFVSRKTKLTPKWLTRAVGRNDLKAPKQEGA